MNKNKKIDIKGTTKMILSIDVGNSHLFGGVINNDNEIKVRFRYNSKQPHTSDQIGIFLKAVLQNNGVKVSELTAIAISSVVPSIDYSLRSACVKYLNLEPFILQAGVKTGLKVTTINPKEVGSDLIAGAISATEHFPNQNIIVVDFGTATTYTAINKNKEFLGATIQPGFKISIAALQGNADLLPSVEIVRTENALGRATAECIQSGIYFSQLASLKELTKRICKQCFTDNSCIIIGTGGFVKLFDNDFTFDCIDPDLILLGLKYAFLKNQ